MNFQKLMYLVLFGILLSSCSSDDNPVEPTESSDPFIVPEEPIPAGPLLFIASISDTSRLFSMELDGSDVKEIAFLPNNEIQYASWSPDGESIVFVATYWGYKKHYDTMIFTMNQNCQNIKQLKMNNTFSDYYEGGLYPIVWSPDSKTIAYDKFWKPEAYGIKHIFSYDLITDTETQITDSMQIIDLVQDWSNNGEILLSLSSHGYTDSFSGLYNATTGNLDKEISFAGMNCKLFRFSEDDSQMLAVASYDTQNFVTIYDPEQDEHQIILEGDETIDYFGVVDWSTTKNMVLIRKNFTASFYQSTSVINEYAIYDLEGNVIQDIPHPFGDNTPFHIVSWRMD